MDVPGPLANPLAQSLLFFNAYQAGPPLKKKKKPPGNEHISFGFIKPSGIHQHSLRPLVFGRSWVTHAVYLVHRVFLVGARCVEELGSQHECYGREKKIDSWKGELALVPRNSADILQKSFGCPHHDPPAATWPVFFLLPPLSLSPVVQSPFRDEALAPHFRLPAGTKNLLHQIGRFLHTIRACEQTDFESWPAQYDLDAESCCSRTSRSG